MSGEVMKMHYNNVVACYKYFFKLEKRIVIREKELKEGKKNFKNYS